MTDKHFDLKNISINNVALWPIHIKWVAIAAFGIFVFILGFLFLDRPQYLVISKEKSAEISVKDSLATLIPQVTQQNKRQENLKQLQSTLTRYSQNVPRPEHLGQTLDDLTKLAVSNQLIVLLLKPEPTPLQEDFYAKIPINLKVAGSYANMTRFIYQVTKLNYYLYLDKVQISLKSSDATQEAAGSFPKNSLVMTVVAEMFYFSPRPIEKKDKDEKKH